MNLLTSLIAEKTFTGLPPCNKKHWGLLGSLLYIEDGSFVDTTMEDPILK